MSKKVLLLFFILFGFLGGCATKYIVPGNRFMTPETLGDSFRGQFDFQQTSANQLVVDTSSGDVDNGVLYSDISRSSFFYANSFFDQFDLYWSHLGGSNSIIGGKFQFYGESRARLTTGHKFSMALGFGGNEHETEDKTVEFNLSTSEILALYGFRMNPFFMPYGSFSFSQYDFKGKLKVADPALNGLKPHFKTKIYSLSGGVEVSYYALIIKIESTFQQLETTKTKDKNRLIFGYSVGLNW